MTLMYSMYLLYFFLGLAQLGYLCMLIHGARKKSWIHVVGGVAGIGFMASLTTYVYQLHVNLSAAFVQLHQYVMMILMSGGRPS